MIVSVLLYLVYFVLLGSFSALNSLNFLAGTLLMYLTEREAFWTLVFLMQREGSALRGLYLEGMAETQTYLKVYNLIYGLSKKEVYYAKANGLLAATGN